MTATSDGPRVRPGWGVFVLLVFGGTIAWAVRFTLGYLLVPTACQIGDWILHLVTLATAAAAVATLVRSFGWAQRVTDPPLRFTLWFGMALDGFFLGAILLEGSAVLFVDACTKAAIP